MSTLSDYFSEKQLLSIRESNSAINVWEGAVSSGKTYASLWRYVDECTNGPPGPFCIMTKTYDTFKRNLLPILQDQILGKNARYYAGRREIYLKDRLVHVIGCSDERAEQKIRGTTFAGAYVDEISLIPESAFNMLLSRMRVPNAKTFGTTNPDSPYHWFKKNFIDSNPDVKSFQFLMDDNPFLTKDYKEFIRRQYKGLWYQRFIEGKWVQAEGAVYDFFDEKMHVIDFPLSTATSYIVGVDYGTTNPCSFVLIGINKNKYPNIWVEDEFYFNSRVTQRQKTDGEYASDLIEFIQGRPVTNIYIDPSAASFRAELVKCGVANLQDAENEVIDGIRFVSKLLCQGTFKICRKCKNLIQEFQSYVWDDNSIKRGEDKPKKENDHALDALRYALFSHFFLNEQGALTPKDLDRTYNEAMGIGPELPPFFQQPNLNHHPMRF